MPKIDFYSIKQSEEEARLFFVCRLCEKVLQQGIKIYIHTESEQQAQEIDDLLWSFKPESFIPHAITGIDEELEDEETPVLIGYGEHYSGKPELLINLSSKIPEFYQDFDRVSEIVINQDAAKSKSREHWQNYKEKGYDMDHHQV